MYDVFFCIYVGCLQVNDIFYMYEYKFVVKGKLYLYRLMYMMYVVMNWLQIILFNDIGLEFVKNIRQDDY